MLNLSNEDEHQPESLGESSGYESFNIRTSRDSSPSISPISPRHSRNGREREHKHTQESQNIEKVELDKEFLDELMGREIPERPLKTDNVQNEHDNLGNNTSSFTASQANDANVCTNERINSNRSSSVDTFTGQPRRGSDPLRRLALEAAMQDIDDAFAACNAPSPQHTASEVRHDTVDAVYTPGKGLYKWSLNNVFNCCILLEYLSSFYTL